MAELEEKLNSILGNQQAMAQIMSLARSLSGGEGKTEEGPSQPDREEEEEGERAEHGPSPQTELSQVMEQLDPNLLRIGMEVIRQVQSTDDRNTALLNALRPFLREERRGRLDRAIQIARMTKMIRAALTALGERGTGEGV